MNFQKMKKRKNVKAKQGRREMKDQILMKRDHHQYLIMKEEMK